MADCRDCERVREIVGAEPGEDTVAAVLWWLAELEHYENLAERYRAALENAIERISGLEAMARTRADHPERWGDRWGDVWPLCVALQADLKAALAPTPREERADGD